MSKKYSCEGCNYTTTNKSLYEQHKNTKKHLKLSDTDKDSNKICVECNKTFSTPSNYYKHKKKYHTTTTKQIIVTPNQTDLSDIINENNELKIKLAKYEEELANAQKKIIELYERLVTKIENKTD